MNPITILTEWLSAQSNDTLKTVLIFCGLGFEMIVLYVMITIDSDGCKIVRKRRWRHDRTGR